MDHTTHLIGQECCCQCGAANRWWWSKVGYCSEEYINWIITGLCPKCHDPKEG